MPQGSKGIIVSPKYQSVKYTSMPKLIAAVFFAFVLLASCKSAYMKFSTTKPAQYPAGSVMVAGIGQADLTPPPGYPMNGYSINGRVSRGYWVRPKATAMYMRDTAGTPFVFVATDLWGITDGQKLAVLELLSKRKNTDFIGESELLISATHSHNSLGVNVPDDAFALSSIGFGFDVGAFDFTVGQIAAAIEKAVDAAEPATVSFSVDTLRGIAKNRSIKAYVRNNPEERALYASQPIALPGTLISKEEIESMIEQRITVISIRNQAGAIKGILASYPVHPTATGDKTEVYSADIYGLAASATSQALADNPIVAFYNGAEGDVAPNYTYHTRYDAVRIAEKLSNAIIKTTRQGSPTIMAGPITHRTSVIEIAASTAEYNPLDKSCYCNTTDSKVRTAKKAMIGASVFAGASDGRIFLSAFGINDGVKSDNCHPEQGYKFPAAKFLFSNVLAEAVKGPLRAILGGIKTSPVSRVPVSIHQVGGMRFVGMPGEFTTMLGRRIKKTVAGICKVGEDSVSLVGLADGYISYVTTPCEYNEQAYEGASNYFGTSTGQVFVAQYEALAKREHADKMQDRKPRKEILKVGSLVEYGPGHLAKLQTWDAEERLENLLVAANGTKLHSHIIPHAGPAMGPIPVAPDEAAAFTFEDAVNEIGSNKDFYPVVELKTTTGETLPVPEHLLTLDKFEHGRATWAIRILEMQKLTGTPVQIVVKGLAGATYSSAYFFSQQ